MLLGCFKKRVMPELKPAQETKVYYSIAAHPYAPLICIKTIFHMNCTKQNTHGFHDVVTPIDAP